ncbi:MAG: DUF1080 domain-containing protein [Luteolibacter sp.]
MNATTTTVSLLASLAVSTTAIGEETWIQLFNGKDLEGWTMKFKDVPVGENHHNIFRVEDGLLKVNYDQMEQFDGRFGHLFYNTPFSHYRVRAEFRFTGDQLPGGPEWAFRNNGFMLHSQHPGEMKMDQNFPNSIEMQFLGNDPEKAEKFANRNMGNLFTPGTKVTLNGEESDGGGGTSSSPAFSGLDWVTVEAEVRGNDEIIHYVNGEEVLRYQNPRLDDGTPLSIGYIAIQAETHNTEFRKIELLPLPGNSSEIPEKKE